ncbi:hypothetical protein AAMO2058_001094800 [Amorphochlora amoebiformis]
MLKFSAATVCAAVVVAKAARSIARASYSARSRGIRALHNGPLWAGRSVRSTGTAGPDGEVVAVMVSFKIKKERIKDFIDVAVRDAKGSVEEKGCFRFDVIQDAKDPSKFAFCEIYRNLEAFDDHQTYPHFKQFVDALPDLLKDGIKENVMICKNIYPNHPAAPWSAKGETAPEEHEHFQKGSLFVIHSPMYVQPEHVDKYLEAIVDDAKSSISQEPGCLRFDVFQNVDKPGELFLYEVYANEPAFHYHCETPHIEKWKKAVDGMYAKEQEEKNSDLVVFGRNVWPPDNYGWGVL